MLTPVTLSIYESYDILRHNKRRLSIYRRRNGNGYGNGGCFSNVKKIFSGLKVLDGKCDTRCIKDERRTCRVNNLAAPENPADVLYLCS